jgi:carbamate kinase
MRVVVALGGNALLERGERPDAAIQQRHVAAAAKSLAEIAQDHELVICHGNGPQIGQLAIESESDPALSEPFPLDVLVAQTQGMIGYWLIQELHAAGVERPVITLVTRTLVRANDPAFAAPSKFIGPVYTERHAHALAKRNGWTVAQDGSHWRRVVASPEPRGLVEIDIVRSMLQSGAVVLAGGGGGIPVVDTGGVLHGVEAVVDKDRTAASIAIDLAADRLLVLTDVDGVMADYGTMRQRVIEHLSLAEIEHMTFPPGSMGPKIDGCRHFAVATCHPALIGALTNAADVLAGRSGTTIGPW